jgi:hypothetical protein
VPMAAAVVGGGGHVAHVEENSPQNYKENRR